MAGLEGPPKPPARGLPAKPGAGASAVANADRAACRYCQMNVVVA